MKNCPKTSVKQSNRIWQYKCTASRKELQVLATKEGEEKGKYISKWYKCLKCGSELDISRTLVIFFNLCQEKNKCLLTGFPREPGGPTRPRGPGSPLK